MTQSPRRLRQAEFIAMIAMCSGSVAFAIDGMLPALPEIAAALSPDSPNSVQLIVTCFMLGMAMGTLVMGPISDAVGRKPVIAGAIGIYVLAALACWAAPSLEAMIASRVVMGFAAAAPRVVSMALVRDLYSGRSMARIMSFVMVVFTLVPALAPSIGHYITVWFGWRFVFICFGVFGALGAAWIMIRQPETLAVEDRRPMNMGRIWSATKEVYRIRITRLSIIAQMMVSGTILSLLSSTQQIFDISFGQGHNFHLWFGLLAIFATSASLLNAKFVVRFGMQRMIRMAFTIQLLLTAVLVMSSAFGGHFGIYLLWSMGQFMLAGFTIGNLNALAMEPVGHIAGVAASIIAAVSTVGGVLIAIPIGRAFDGTALPFSIGIFLVLCVALYVAVLIGRAAKT